MKADKVASSFGFLLLLCISVAGEVNAFELGTHAAITRKAYEKSVLADPQFLQELGLVDGKKPFGEAYLDVSGTEVRSRSANEFEQRFMPANSQELSISGWLMRGAIREDDLGAISLLPMGDDPHDDPYGSIFRVFNHFYDPVFDRPLTTYNEKLGQKAPDWATGSADVFQQPNSPDANRRNHFTVFDARESMYRALTGLNARGDSVAATEAIRNQYWATTFRALGDVIHLLQDIGQPQHTRNDPHSGKPGFGHESTFELYLESRAAGKKPYKINGTEVVLLPQLLPKSPLAQAFGYALRNWDALVRYTENGVLQPDNNALEREIRPIALGRANYLFVGSPRGGQAAATMYSLLGTARLNELNPYDWLRQTLTQLPSCASNRVAELLPLKRRTAV